MVQYQYKILLGEVIEAHQALNTFADTFKELYYQQKASWIHFIHAAIHTLHHLAAKIICGQHVASVILP